MEVIDPSYLGRLTFGEPESEELALPGNPQRKVAVTREHGTWRPAERLAEFLPEGFSVPIDCYSAPDGLRRIIPCWSFEALIDLGAVGGLAILHGMRGFDPQVDHAYRAMHLIHQRVRGRQYRGTRGMREHLTRSFDYSRDLYVERLGRLLDDERDVLPDDVGLDARGQGHRLSVAELTETGRRAAQDAGCCNPTSKLAIVFGLFEAAKLNPLEVKAEEVPALVRMSLFDIDPSKGVPSEELIEIVAERLLEAIDPHLDDFQEAFDQWFSGPRNSLVKQIAQQKKKRGGKLQREDVRQALLHLGWQAYEYVGPCIHAFMRTIKNSIPKPLNDQEKRLFEHMHESRPYYGNVPLALLAERSSLLERAALAIWDEPDNQDHVRVLHRLLWYYSDMARRKREADRRSQQRSPCGPPTSSRGVCIVHQAAEGDAAPNAADRDSEEARHCPRKHRGGTVEFIDNLHLPPSPEEVAFAQVAEHIRHLHGIKCAADCGRWEYRRERESEEPVTITVRCECGSVACAIRMAQEEFAQHAEQVLGWQRTDVEGRSTGGEESSADA